MKNTIKIPKNRFFSMLILFVLLAISCTKNTKSVSEISASLTGKTLTFEKLFDNLIATNIDLSSDTVLYISYEWNKSNHTIKVSSFEKKEIDFFPIPFSDEKDNTTDVRAAKKEYKVSCENGKSSWTKGCDGKVGCGIMIIDCLDDGGCATVCKNKMIYLPQEKEFILLPAANSEK